MSDNDPNKAQLEENNRLLRGHNSRIRRSIDNLESDIGYLQKSINDLRVVEAVLTSRVGKLFIAGDVVAELVSTRRFAAEDTQKAYQARVSELIGFIRDNMVEIESNNAQLRNYDSVDTVVDVVTQYLMEGPFTPEPTDGPEPGSEPDSGGTGEPSPSAGEPVVESDSHDGEPPAAPGSNTADGSPPSPNGSNGAGSNETDGSGA
jgi:hypothetical protein